MWHAFRWLFSGSLIGKIIGFLREILFAAFYGTSMIAGAYRAAHTAIFIPIQFFASDTLNAGFLPLYARYRKGDQHQAQHFFWVVSLLLTFISVVLAAVMIQFTEFWARLLFPGFSDREIAITVRFIQVMALGIPFYFLSALFSYLEMGNGGYALSSIRASVQSIGLISGTLAAYYLRAPVLLAWGFTAAYLFLSAYGLFVLLRKNLLFFPKRSFTWTVTRRAVKDFWLAIRYLLILPFFLQGNIAIERAVASLQGVEVVAALDYAKLITETAVVLLAVPLGLASLSEMSHATEAQIRQQLGKVIPVLLLVTIPLSSFLLFHCQEVLSLIYARGHFDEASLFVTEPILFGLAIGLWAQVGGYVLIKFLNAQMRNREVLFIMISALALNAFFNVAFYRLLGPFTLGLGTSLYGIAVFLLGASAMKIWPSICKPFLTLSLASLLYGILESVLLISGASGILAAFLRFLLFWSLLIIVTPHLRQVWKESWAVVRRRRSVDKGGGG